MVTECAISNLKAAQTRAMAIRPTVGGFPYLAEALRQAGVRTNIWGLPSLQSLYITDLGAVVEQMPPLVQTATAVPPYNQELLIKAIRTDQAGETSFPEFLMATWQAGVICYEVDFAARTVTYFGVNEESYLESYPQVVL